jgi:hypothetical protein
MTRPGGSEQHEGALIEARMPDLDPRRATDPLLRHLAATGQCRWHMIDDPDSPRPASARPATPSRRPAPMGPL